MWSCLADDGRQQAKRVKLLKEIQENELCGIFLDNY